MGNADHHLRTTHSDGVLAGRGRWTVAAPVTKLSDSLELDYEVTMDGGPGEHTIAVRVTDDYDNLAVEKAVVR